MGYSTNESFRQQIAEHQKYLRKASSEAFEKEGLSLDQAEPIAMLVVAGIIGIIQEWIVEGDELDVDRAFAVLKQSICNLVGMAKEAQGLERFIN